MKKLFVLFVMIFALSSTSCSVLNKEKEETEETSRQMSKSKRKKNKDRTEEEETSKMEETSETEETTQETRVAQMQTISSTEAQAQQNTQIYTNMYVVNCRESITLRTSPSTKASAIRQIPLGAAVSYIETSENGFYKVSYMGDTGYALSQYLSTENVSNSANMLPYPILYVVNCKESITLRTSPSTKASAIRQIPLGAAVSYIETSENGFYKVSYMGDTGYALSQYLSSYESDEPPALGEEYIFRDGVVVNCKTSITLRESASTSAKEITQIPLDSLVIVYEKTGNGFYYVGYPEDGDLSSEDLLYGYVLEGYILLLERN